MRKTFLARLLAVPNNKSAVPTSSTQLPKYVPPTIPDMKKPLALRIALLNWEPHVVAGGKVRGVKICGCVLPLVGVSAIEEEDGFKAIYDGERYMFGSNETPGEFVHEVKTGSLLTFTVWGMMPSDAENLSYGRVIVVDGVACTQKGKYLYFNATLVVNIERKLLPFINALPSVHYAAESDVLCKLRLTPYYMQAGDPCCASMPSFYFEDVVMKVKADQPFFKPYVEFEMTLVEGPHRIAITSSVRPALCSAFFEERGVQAVMESTCAELDTWDFTLIGYLTSTQLAANQRIFVTSALLF